MTELLLWALALIPIGCIIYTAYHSAVFSLAIVVASVFLYYVLTGEDK